MEPDKPTIAIIRERIERSELERLVAAHFSDMVKIVVDLQREVVAVGGELHADAEQLLLEQGSRQADLWGANYYPGRGAEECLEYTALINIRPSQADNLPNISPHVLPHPIIDMVARFEGLFLVDTISIV